MATSVKNLTKLQREQLEKLGWTPETLGDVLGQGFNFEAIADMKVWERRYRTEGEVWGDKPSVTARLAAKKVEKHSRFIDLGCGYGRDVNFLLKNGFVVHGLDESSHGLSMATRAIECLKNNAADRATLSVGNFLSSAAVRPAFTDAVVSHRVLHLIPPKEVAKNVSKMAECLREGGQIFISARSPKDFKPNEMEWVEGEKGRTATYKDPTRIGQVLNFWDENRFEQEFSPYFNIKSCLATKEQEALLNPVDTNLLLLSAVKKPQSEIDNYEHSLLGLA